MERPTESGPFEVTEPGMEALHEMTAEVENVLERYEVFGNVLYDPETGECEFVTGVGDDLRIPVYEAEAVSPVRAVLLVELCDGEFARMSDDWKTAIHDREFFDALLLPVVERPLVGEGDIDAIIDAGVRVHGATGAGSLPCGRRRPTTPFRRPLLDREEEHQRRADHD